MISRYRKRDYARPPSYEPMNIERLIENNLGAQASIWDESVNGNGTGKVNANVDAAAAAATESNPSRPQRARTGFREEDLIEFQNAPLGSSGASVSSQNLVAQKWTVQTSDTTSVPNPLLSTPFANPLPTDEAQIRLQIAIAAQLAQEGAGPRKKPMIVASTGDNESLSVLPKGPTNSINADSSSSYALSHMPAELFEPIPLAPGFQHKQQQQLQQQPSQVNLDDDKEWNEIGSLLDGPTPKQEPRAKLTSANVSTNQQQPQTAQVYTRSSTNEASGASAYLPPSLPPMPPIYSTSTNTGSVCGSKNSINVPVSATMPPLQAAIAPKQPAEQLQQLQSLRQQVDINSHASMLASAILTPKRGEKRDVLDATLFYRQTPIHATPMWMNTKKVETEQGLRTMSQQGTASCSSSNERHPAKTKKTKPNLQKTIRIISHKMDEKDSETQSPQAFFDDLISKRGYSTVRYPSLDCGYHPPPSPLQLASFGTAVIKAVESDDAQQLSSLLKSGLSRNPCNSFSDYILCRSIKRGCVKSFRVQVEAGADLRIADDFGRTTLHHAAWAASPNFEIIDALLKADKNMLRLTDRLGRTPLDYVHGSHRNEWTDHLKEIVDDFWPENGQDWREEEVPLKVGREVGMIPDPEDALPAQEASLVAMGKVAPTTLDFKATVDDKANTSQNEMSESLQDMSLAGTGTKRKLDKSNTSDAQQKFINAKRIARRQPSSRKKVVASRCA